MGSKMGVGFKITKEKGQKGVKNAFWQKRGFSEPLFSLPCRFGRENIRPLWGPLQTGGVDLGVWQEKALEVHFRGGRYIALRRGRIGDIRDPQKSIMGPITV
jgi:hypothetical protein